MHRRHFLQVTIPSVLIGLLMLGTGIASVRWINQMQSNLAAVVSRNVTSLQAAQELEIRLRQLRFHSLAYAIEPTDVRRARIDQDHANFEEALDRARGAATTDEERLLLQHIEQGYQTYQLQLDSGPRPLGGQSRDVLMWVDRHPVSDLIAPCHELLSLNHAEMERAAREHEEVSRRVRMTTWLLALLGPLGGLIGGYGLARGLSRSINWLNVWVHDVHARLDSPAGGVRLDGDVRQLDGQVQQVVARVQEMVERIDQQRQHILRAEQLAAVGRLAAGMAHEIRNPLTTIKLLIGVALRGGPAAPLTPRDLEMIHREVVRLEQTVQGLLDFARPPKASLRPCDLRRVVGEAIELVRVRRGQQQVALELDQPDVPVSVEIDPGQFRGVMVNLLLNALEAMPQGGTLGVSLQARPEGGAQVEVRDTGTGIVPAMEGRLFTPFATTRPNGTGLGLSICRRVVEQHGGAIAGHNLPGRGACFSITLPPVSARFEHAEVAGRR